MQLLSSKIEKRHAFSKLTNKQKKNMMNFFDYNIKRGEWAFNVGDFSKHWFVRPLRVENCSKSILLPSSPGWFPSSLGALVSCCVYFPEVCLSPSLAYCSPVQAGSDPDRRLECQLRGSFRGVAQSHRGNSSIPVTVAVIPRTPESLV